MKKIRTLFAAGIMAVLLAILLPTTAFAADREAVVTSYMLNVRAGAAQEYTIIDVAYEGNKLAVVDVLDNGWAEVRFNGQTGYVSSLFLRFTGVEVSQSYDVKETVVKETEVKAAADLVPAVTEGANASVKGEGVYFRSGPSLSSTVLDTLSNGTRVRVNGVTAAWYEVSYQGQTGYIHGDFVARDGQAAAAAPVLANLVAAQEMPAAELIAAREPTTPAEAPAAEPQSEATPAPTTAPKTTVAASGQAIVDTAMKYQGVAYRWGGTSPESGFDCSGLVYYVYKQFGITLNRVAQSMYYNGKSVDLNSLQPGDILLFGSSVYNIWHAGIYIGNGQFIHAPHSGAVVSTQSIAGTYGMRLVAARRIV